MLMLVSTPNNSMGHELFISSPEWNITDNKKYTIHFTFSSGKVFKLPEAIGISSEIGNGVVSSVIFDFADDFAKAKHIQFWVNGKNVGQFGLKGSSQAVDALRMCDKQMNKGKNALKSDTF